MKKCILYNERICNNCGECLICDLDHSKLCDNCGKCLSMGYAQDFLSVLVHADESAEKCDNHEDDAISENERQFLAFLDEPIDLEIPDPLEIDSELYEKWEQILAADFGERSIKENKKYSFDRAPANYAIRYRRKR